MVRWLFAVVIVATLAGCTLAPPAPLADDVLPRSMAALGDSITRALNPGASAPGEHPTFSWAIGTEAPLDNASYAERLRALGALDEGAHLFARSGARIGDLARQARLAVDARAEHVVILMGGNDACVGTSPERFRDAFRAGADVLREGLPAGATVFVLSVPNLTAVWDSFHDEPRAQSAWRVFRVCPALLGEERTDDERAQVTERVEAYNAIIAEESAAYGFANDDGAAFAARLLATDVSDLDYFHPSFDGQRRLADVAWSAAPFPRAG